MMKCKKCGNTISDRTTSGLCRKCSQKVATKKREDTCLKRYGVKNVMHKKEFVDKITDTMMRRYGAKRAMQVPKFMQKYKDTVQSLYGVPYYVMSEDCLANSHFRISDANKKLANRLNGVGISVEMEFRIEDKQYDIHIVGTNILIEINPTYTHNVIGNHWNKDGLSSDYHINKTAIAAANGYRVIHIWDWDNIDKIVQLISPKTKIYARNCELRKISKFDYVEFTSKYHLQGPTKGFSLCLGLYYNDMLVEIMSWGKPRFNKNYEYELLRLCSHSDYRIVGGAEKLFKHSIDILHPANIISYCDLSKFSGEVYHRLGMELLRINSPQEVWSQGKERVLSTTLRQLGYDKLFDSNYGKGTSNEQLMIEHGWLPVYDCGQAVFVYGNSQKVDEPTTAHPTIEEYKKIANATKKSKMKICAFCGKEFLPKSNFQKYCKGPHIRICPVCGKEYEETNSDNLKRPPHACSYECRAKKTRQTSIERYGCVAPGNNEDARKKAKATMQKKYGADYTLQSKELSAKVKQTLQDRYGVENPNQIQAAKDKRKQTFRLKDDTLLFYQEPRTNIINAKELQVYKLDVEYAKDWLNKYHPFKAPRGMVLAFGLCDASQTYCIMAFKKSRNKNYVAELCRLWMLPTYDVVDGYQVLSQQASEFGIYNIVAYVNLSFENVNDYKSIGMEYIRTNQRTKWWYRNGEIVSDASCRQKGLSHNDMIFKGYKFAYDCGIDVYEFTE